MPVIVVADRPEAPPVMPPVTIGADQLYKVPAGTIPLVILTGVTENNTPSQLTAVIALIEATGFTVTVNTNDAPTPQLTEVGVTI